MSPSKCAKYSVEAEKASLFVARRSFGRHQTSLLAPRLRLFQRCFQEGVTLCCSLFIWKAPNFSPRAAIEAFSAVLSRRESLFVARCLFGRHQTSLLAPRLRLFQRRFQEGSYSLLLVVYLEGTKLLSSRRD